MKCDITGAPQARRIYATPEGISCLPIKYKIKPPHSGRLNFGRRVPAVITSCFFRKNIV